MQAYYLLIKAGYVGQKSVRYINTSTRKSRGQINSLHDKNLCNNQTTEISLSNTRPEPRQFF